MGARIRSLKLSEAEFTRQVIGLAQSLGWLIAHFRAARTATGWATPVQGDGKGFPDLLGVHLLKRRAFAAELKVGRNKATPEQKRWLQAFEAAGIPAYTWRPDEFETEIRAVLEGRS